MDSDLRKYIELRRQLGETGQYTHVNQISPTGKFNIGLKDIESFWELYQTKVFNSQHVVSGLAEYPLSFGPILGDIDVKVYYDKNIDLTQKLYSNSHVKNTINVFQKKLKSIIYDYKPKHGICFLLEKDVPTLTDNLDYIKHGFHLHFIHTFMSRVDQEIHLFPRIKSEITEEEYFKDLGIKDSGETIDVCANKCWLLYGSRKKENLQSYKLTKIFNDKLEEITLEEALRDFSLIDAYGDELKMENDLEFYLPRILSIHPENKTPVKVKTELQCILKKHLKKAKDSKKIYENMSISDALRKAKELMKLISPFRADNYDDWIDIGWILYNLGDGCQEALEMWIDFSSKTTKNNFTEAGCCYHWSHMKGGEKSIGSLYYYAKLDNPDSYKRLQKIENDKLFNDSLNGGHYDMAKWLHNKYRDEFVCACVKQDIWYHYENHRWVLSEKGMGLRQKITPDLVEEYKKLKKEICNEMGDEEDESPEMSKRLKIVNKIIANLKSSPFKRNILTECVELFYHEGFANKLDNDPNLLHFTNGVLDLKEMRLRPGRPTDFLSLSTEYDFKEFSEDDVEVQEVHEHLDKVFTDPELKQYFLEYSASLLKGGNSAKVVLVKTGAGNNAKSINIELIQLALGRYVKSLPTALLTGKRTASASATPELSDMSGIRFATIQETSPKEVLNIGVLKELSGNDVMYVRGLFEKAKQIKPLFKICLITNSLPNLPDDPATWARLRVLPYDSSFEKNPSDVPEAIDEQFRQRKFKQDPFFAEKLPKMKYPFVWVLFETYKKMVTNGRSAEPEKVRDATILYRKNNDIFLQFIEDKITRFVPTAESKKFPHITVSALYKVFKEWYRESYPNMSIPTKNDMKQDFVKRWGLLDSKHRWYGYIIKSSEDSDDEEPQEEDPDTKSPKSPNKEKVEKEEPIKKEKEEKIKTPKPKKRSSPRVSKKVNIFLDSEIEEYEYSQPIVRLLIHKRK